MKPKLQTLNNLENLNLKLPFRSQLINFLQKYFKKLAYYIYYNKCYLRRNVLSLKENTTQPSFSYFQIAASFWSMFIYNIKQQSMT